MICSCNIRSAFNSQTLGKIYVFPGQVNIT